MTGTFRVQVLDFFLKHISKHFKIFDAIRIFFSYLKGRKRKKKEISISHPLVHFPNTCNSWGWAKSKSRAQNSICVSHLGGKSRCQLSPMVCIGRRLGIELELQPRHPGKVGETQQQLSHSTKCPDTIENSGVFLTSCLEYSWIVGRNTQISIKYLLHSASSLNSG